MFVRETWEAEQRAAIADYAGLCQLVEHVEALKAAATARVIDAYRWPDEVPPQDRPDNYRAEILDGTAYGEDLTSELAVANRTSYRSAEFLVDEVARLTTDLPGCWDKVVTAQAPLWQARLVASACQRLDAEQCGIVDRLVAPCLGGFAPQRLRRRINSAVAKADPNGLRHAADELGRRCARTGGLADDPLTGWVSALIDRRDQVILESTIAFYADRFALNGDTSTLDARRAKALGLLANPAAALAFANSGAAPPLEATAPKATVYVHVYAESLDDPDEVARVEKVGPVLIDQIAELTRAAKVRLAPVIHVGGAGIAADSYEIPDAVREHVLAAEPNDCVPYSSAESRFLDLDHIRPWKPGLAGQTATDNLAPLSRRGHRLKTHADWVYTRQDIGVYLWTTRAGQRVRVDQTGTHPLRE
jgi:hypothetical protein